MTNLEAIKAKLNYPFSGVSPDNAYILALQDRGLTSSDVYSDKKSLELAYADLCYTLVSSPNITEGGYSVSLSEKKLLTQVADSIFSKHGLISPLAPKATFFNVW